VTDDLMQIFRQTRLSTLHQYDVFTSITLASDYSMDKGKTLHCTNCMNIIPTKAEKLQSASPQTPVEALRLPLDMLLIHSTEAKVS
jgi:hypothetical protein